MVTPFEKSAILHLIEPLKLANEIELENKDIEEKHYLMTNPEWFVECLLDLVRFSLNITPEKKLKIRISLDTSENNCLFEFDLKDVVLSDEQSRHLFEPFYSSRQLLGTKDIGLSKAKGFLSQMKAELTIEKSKGFIIKVPLLLD